VRLCVTKYYTEDHREIQEYHRASKTDFSEYKLLSNMGKSKVIHEEKYLFWKK